MQPFLITLCQNIILVQKFNFDKLSVISGILLPNMFELGIWKFGQKLDSWSGVPQTVTKYIFLSKKNIEIFKYWSSIWILLQCVPLQHSIFTAYSNVRSNTVYQIMFSLSDVPFVPNYNDLSNAMTQRLLDKILSLVSRKITSIRNRGYF